MILKGVWVGVPRQSHPTKVLGSDMILWSYQIWYYDFIGYDTMRLDMILWECWQQDQGHEEVTCD